ncbi:MAG: hypothetical protein AAFQ79_15655 [Pseudomonadota bacterium]
MRQRLKRVVAATALAILAAGPGFAQDQDLTDLFDALRNADPDGARAIEGRILSAWAQTGSPSLDLLMQRGRDAMEADEYTVAIEHLTALIDHAPELAHPYSMRANAYFLEGMYGPAIDDLGRALARNPMHFEAMTGLATLMEQLGYLEDALSVNREIEAIHPEREGLAEAIRRLEAQVEGAAL